MKVATRKAVDEQSFTTTLLVDQSPFEVFAAVTNVRGWWTGEITGKSLRVGDEFTFRYEDLHRSTQRVVEVIPEKRIVWQVTEAHLGFAATPDEWKGTRVVFDISRKGNKTELRFTHEGLVPSFECFEACHGGWTFYVEDSLRKLITTGKGEKEVPWRD